MELVPIIKQALLVITILFLVVVAVSYVASKFKPKKKSKLVKKLSPQKRIKRNIKVVKDNHRTSKPVTKDGGLTNKKPAPESRVPSQNSSRLLKSSLSKKAPSKKEDKPRNLQKQYRKKQVQKPPPHRAEKRVEVIKDLTSPKGKINKNDSGGIGFN